MGLWRGIEKMFEGLAEVIYSPVTLMKDRRYARRESLSGTYTVKILGGLIAKVTYHGAMNAHDVDFVAREGSTEDLWDAMNDDERRSVQCEINSFLFDIQKKANADCYDL